MPTHNYAFAHLVLPEFAAAYPADFFALMPSEHCDQLLDLLWREAEAKAGPLPEGFDEASTKVTCGAIDSKPAVVVEMPRPTVIAEAFFVAIVSLTGLPSHEQPTDANLRCITLELGRNLDGSSRTVLCEWRYGTHYNYDDGPPPTLFDFCRAVDELLQQPPPGPAPPRRADA